MHTFKKKKKNFHQTLNVAEDKNEEKINEMFMYKERIYMRMNINWSVEPSISQKVKNKIG